MINKSRGIILIGSGHMGKTLSMALNNPENYVHTTNAIEINGVFYEELPPKPLPSRLPPIVHYRGIGESEYTRELPTGLDLIKEFTLIQKKLSKLTKWERDRVTKEFFKRYKPV